MSLREKRVKRVKRLRSRGLLYREIAELMGLSVSYVGDLIDDPEGLKVRARKDGYRTPCVDCGQMVSGSGGPGVYERCRGCAAAKVGREKSWPRYEEIAWLRAQGLLNTEIAQRLGASPQAIRSAVYQARETGFEIARTTYPPAAGHRTMR